MATLVPTRDGTRFVLSTGIKTLLLRLQENEILNSTQYYTHKVPVPEVISTKMGGISLLGKLFCFQSGKERPMISTSTTQSSRPIIPILSSFRPKGFFKQKY